MWRCCCVKEEDGGPEMLFVGGQKALSDEVFPVPSYISPNVDFKGSSGFSTSSGPRKSQTHSDCSQSVATDDAFRSNLLDDQGVATLLSGGSLQSLQSMELSLLPLTYEITITIGEKGLGLRLFVMPLAMSISRIDEGAINSHNKAHPEQLVRINDFLMAVNEKTDVQDMARELQAKGAVTLRFYRPKRLSIRVPKRGLENGLRVDAIAGHTLIYIHEIVKGGAFARYNRTCGTDLAVLQHDCILSVNGIHKSAAKMALELEDPDSEDLDIVLVKLAPPKP